jgi:hypothetical protein
VLVRLAPGTSRQQLETLKPDLQAMQDVVVTAGCDGAVRGVIVTTTGGETTGQPHVLHVHDVQYIFVAALNQGQSLLVKIVQYLA